MRLFVAIEAPDAWQRAAAEAQDALLAALPHEVRDVLRPVDPSLMHLTLRFLGEVDADAAEALQSSLAERVAAIDFSLALGAVGTFGAPQRTAVAWLGIEGDLEALHALAGSVEMAVRDAGLPGEDRALSPHLTLARVRRQAGPDERRVIAEAARSLRPFDAARTTMRVSEIALVRSDLGPSQPRYEVLARYS